MSILYEQQYFLVLELNIIEISSLHEQERLVKIKKAYHKLAKRYHPDCWTPDSVLSKEETNAKFREVNDAYLMITDPSFRMKKEAEKNVNLDVTCQVFVSLEQAIYGHDLFINFNSIELGSDGKPVELPKEDITFEIKRLHVKIPPATRHGDMILFKGMGMKKESNTGNLQLQVNINFGRYQVDLNNPYTILSDIQLSLDQMLMGDLIEVPTIFGLRTLDVPPGTQPNQKISINNLGPNHIYSILFTVHLKYPSKADLKHSKVWSALKINWKDEELKERQRLEDEVKKSNHFYMIFN